MYIRKSTRTYKGKTYTNHLLVESVQTAKGPRQRTICSLGSLESAPAEDWLGLAHKLQSALQGQESLSGSSTEIQEWVEKARNKKKSTVGSDGDRSTVTVEPDQVQVEQAREAGPVHVGHQLWGQLEMNRILQQAGLSARACRIGFGAPPWETSCRKIFPSLRTRRCIAIWTGCIRTAKPSSVRWRRRKRRCSTWMTPSICMT